MKLAVPVGAAELYTQDAVQSVERSCAAPEAAAGLQPLAVLADAAWLPELAARQMPPGQEPAVLEEEVQSVAGALELVALLEQAAQLPAQASAAAQLLRAARRPAEPEAEAVLTQSLEAQAVQVWAPAARSQPQASAQSQARVAEPVERLPLPFSA